MYSWCRYRASLEPALRHFDAEINSKETVGVAGRTGSGKSTLMLTLFRMYELSNGRIKIDDVDISKVGLHQLRKRLAIIPQDPVLFSGTVRDNLGALQYQFACGLGNCHMTERCRGGYRSIQ